MGKFASRSVFLAGCLWLEIFTYGSLAPASEVLPGVVPKTLKRTVDPVVTDSSDFGRLLGKEIGKLRLFAENGGKLETIPFQIDEISPDGEYLFQVQNKHGAWKKVERKIGKDGAGILTEKDELVFIARDSGGRVPREGWPTPEGVEIEIIDHLDGGKGYVYLFYFDSPPPLSPKNYVDYRPEGELTITEEYGFGFSDPKHPAVFNIVAFVNAMKDQKPLDRLMANGILDRFKLKVQITFFFKMLRMNWDENDAHAYPVAYIDGPVRVIELVDYSMDLILGIPSPKLRRTLFNYPGRTVIPNELFIPFRPSIFISQASALAAFDFRSRASGAIVYNALMPNGVRVNGHMEPEEIELASKKFTLTKDFPNWIAYVGDFGGVLGRLRMNDRMWKEFKYLESKKTFWYSVHYIDDKNLKEGNEDEPGRYGEFGWQIQGVADVRRGHYVIDMILFAAKDFKKGDEQKYLNVDDSPLETKVIK